jgi:hypothetical protein
MEKVIWLSVIVGLYFFLFLSAVIGFGILRRRRRREREPVEFKLLRGPGESLRREVQGMDANLFIYAIVAAFIPLPVSAFALYLLARIFPLHGTQLSVGILILGILICGLFTGWWLLSKIHERHNYALGYLGERTVGEVLALLVADGYQVFHDLPAEAKGSKFNLDHVVVGSTGVFLIETKTRRKGRARPGFKDHEVGYDGQKLIWPWAEDRHGLEQAEREARWLSEWLNKLTGFGLTAKPILALPGWYVKSTAHGSVNVVNAKGLPSAIKGRGTRVLSDEQIDIIARQLDQRCRDVED